VLIVERVPLAAYSTDLIKGLNYKASLRAFSTDTTGQLNILGHDGNTLGVDSTQVGIFKESNKVSFSSFLEGQDSRSLETKIGFEIFWMKSSE